MGGFGGGASYCRKSTKILEITTIGKNGRNKKRTQKERHQSTIAIVSTIKGATAACRGSYRYTPGCRRSMQQAPPSRRFYLGAPLVLLPLCCQLALARGLVGLGVLRQTSRSLAGSSRCKNHTHTYEGQKHGTNKNIRKTRRRRKQRKRPRTTCSRSLQSTAVNVEALTAVYSNPYTITGTAA